MYCDPADAVRRRATQTAMHEIFDALCKLLAPVVAFTADEAWRYSSPGGSIHLQEFDPDP
jgi:isoleucyl-tRNA synthetase